MQVSTSVPLASLTPQPAAALGQLWLANEIGGYWFSPNLSRYLRNKVQKRCRFRQFASMPDDTQNAKHAGDTFHWNIYGDLNDTEGGQLLETDKMTHGRLEAAQGSCTVTEYGHGVRYSGKLDDLSEHPVKAIIDQALQRHCARTLDREAYAEFAKGLVKVSPAAGTSPTGIEVTENGTAGVANNSALTAAHVKAMSELARERDIPTYDHGDYYMIARPTAFTVVSSDLENLNQYTESGITLIREGEKGRYEGVRFVEQTNIAKSANFATNNKSDEAFLIGDDAVAECIVIPEEMRGAIPGDYGRDKGIAWYYLGGFAKTRIAPEDERILHWDSAA